MVHTKNQFASMPMRKLYWILNGKYATKKKSYKHLKMFQVMESNELGDDIVIGYMIQRKFRILVDEPAMPSPANPLKAMEFL